jgi:hypothetical protein
VTKLVRILVLAFTFASLSSVTVALAGGGKGVPSSASNGSEACENANDAHSEVQEFCHQCDPTIGDQC